MAEETANVIMQRQDGVWELRDQEGEIIELCGKRPGVLLFMWLLLCETRKQTALLRKIDAATDSVACEISNQPNLKELVDKLVARLAETAGQ